ncbi:MAG: pyridoxamine 5'-phosphate oxidase family protein [bacterium]|nr:hypothetical protein [Deltaproteobacteria bacterium]MCP4905491.1 pyridoxamine 5'-phosphate oxidase family protein [bacterium]
MPEWSADGMEILEQPECEGFLKRAGVGLLAMAGVAAPVVRPVNFAVHEDYILIRTGEGQILDAACAAEAASFVITDVDRFEHSGWSVVVVGTLMERSSLGDVEDVPLRPWSKADKHHFVGLSIQDISGRRLAAARMP